MYPQGGYKTLTITQLANVLAALNVGRISFRALRIYFAALTAVAAREAADRSRLKAKPRPSRFLIGELARTCGCPVGRVRGELRALERAGLLWFSESLISLSTAALPGSKDIASALAGGRSALRPVPLPRPVLRCIARSSRVATIKTMLAYCVRGLSLTRNGEVKGKGTAKARWIADTFGISLRAARSARAELIQIGFISPDEGSKQWKLNRDGAYFAVNMAFTGAEFAPLAAPPFASPSTRNCTPSAPPYKDLKTPYGLKDQKTRNREGAGSCESKNLRKPDLSDVQAEDLRSVSRMLILHQQALRSGLARDGEAGRIEFLAAAVHAIQVGTRNPAGLFVAILRRKLWAFITQADEEQARKALRRTELRAQSTSCHRRAQSPSQVYAGGEVRSGQQAQPLHLSALLSSVVGQLSVHPEARV